MRRLILLLSIVVVHFLAPQPSLADKRVALVIGNSGYENVAALLNPSNDAAAVSEMFRKASFDVVESRRDLSNAEMRRALRAFSDQARDADVAVIYYAGHGIEMDGTNYLIPVDAVLERDTDAYDEAISLDRVLQAVESTKQLRLVVLDACRDNPFQPPSPVRYRSFANLGLAAVQAPRGTLVAFSTTPGQLAADGKEANSIYTATLARVMLEPKLEIREIFEKVGSEVRKRTLDDQIPWYETSLTDRYYFQPPEGITVVAGKPLVMADAGRRDTQVRRGMEAEPVQWFHNLTNPEWSQLDWEIQQRVKRLTADEIPELEHKANGGNLVAQTTLGIVFLEGIDKAVDQSGKVTRYNASNVKALKWLRQAADAGFPVAQAVMGEMYYQAQGVDRDLAESRRWLEKAARVDYTRAKLDLLQLKMETNPREANIADVMKMQVGR